MIVTAATEIQSFSQFRLSDLGQNGNAVLSGQKRFLVQDSVIGTQETASAPSVTERLAGSN
jgi:hypothetical protein